MSFFPDLLDPADKLPRPGNDIVPVREDSPVARFGHRFQDLDKVESFNKHLVEYYLKAKARFSL